MTFADILAYGRRYLTVGALCALIHNLIMIGSDFAGMHYLPATLLSVAVVAPLGYFLHCRFTFRRAQSIVGFARFALGFAIAYPLMLGLMVLFRSLLGLPMIIASPLATGVLVVFNYVSAHWAIVRRRTGQQPFPLRTAPVAGLVLTTEAVAGAPKDNGQGGATGGTAGHGGTEL